MNTMGYNIGGSNSNSPNKGAPKNQTLQPADYPSNSNVYKQYLDNGESLSNNQMPQPPKQFATIQASGGSHSSAGMSNSQADQEKSKILKQNKKTHLRSLTSHKGNEGEQ